MDPIQRQCSRMLHGSQPRTAREVLLELAEEAGQDEMPDRYGGGPLITRFEQEVAALLGKPAAVFMPSGTMAQPIVMRLWSERRGCQNIVMHPTSHLLLHEHHAYQHLHGLRAIPVGHRSQLMTPMALRKVVDPYAALLVELPQREIGGQLPSWDMLQALLDEAEGRGAALHLDGARLWECGPHYGRSYAEIVDRFDSVYVSFYKGLSGVAGAILAGPKDLVDAARVWKRRQGGDLISLYPYILSARKGLRERLPRMGAYVVHAQKVAAALQGLQGLRVTPQVPVTPMMHLHLAGEPARLAERAREVSVQSGVWLFRQAQLRPTDVPGWCSLELSIGEAGLAVSPLEAATCFRRVLQPRDSVRV